MTRPCAALLLALATAGAVSLAGGAARSAVAPDEVRAKARRLLADPSYQTELPLAGGGSSRCDPEDPACFGRLDPLRRGVRSSELPEVQPGGCGGGSVVAQALLWAILAAALAALVVFVVGEVRGRNKSATVSADADVDAEGERTARPALDLADIEALAAAGRFAEAVHLLLVRVLAWVAPATVKRGRPEALTSREVLAGVRDVDVAGALDELVGTVEVSLFGGQPVDRVAYDRCAASYEQLATTVGAER